MTRTAGMGARRASRRLRGVGGLAALTVRETGGAVAGVGHPVHEFPDRDLLGVEQDGSEPAGKVHLDLVNAGIGGEGLSDRLLTAVTVHAGYLDRHELIVLHVMRHGWAPPRAGSGARVTIRNIDAGDN